MTTNDRQPGLTPAEIYERDMVPAIFAGWVDPMLDLVAPRPGERLLDVACGTGVVTRRAVALVGSTGKVAGLGRWPAHVSSAALGRPSDDDSALSVRRLLCSRR